MMVKFEYYIHMTFCQKLIQIQHLSTRTTQLKNNLTMRVVKTDGTNHFWSVKSGEVFGFGRKKERRAVYLSRDLLNISCFVK